MYKISVSLGAYQMRGILSVAFLFICFLYQKVTATGARVTTVSAGAHHTTSEEPEKITVKADPGTQLGVSFGDGGSVRQVASKGQAATLGIRMGWRLTGIGGGSPFPVTETSTPKDILEALAAARKRGKAYSLGFSLGGAKSPAEGGKHENKASNTSSSNGAAHEEKVVKTEAVNLEGVKNERNDEGKVEDKEAPRQGEASKASKQEEEVVKEGSVLEEGKGDGEVTLMYEMYDEKFPIKRGCITAADIDEVYCLSFVMPNCTLHLGHMNLCDRYVKENAGEVVPYLPESSPGIFQGLVDGGVYWVYVSRDDEEEQKDRDRMKQVVQGMQEDVSATEGGGVEHKDDGRNGLESCSCVYGNPCVDEYGCKDWHSRFAVAKANGWKGF